MIENKTESSEKNGNTIKYRISKVEENIKDINTKVENGFQSLKEKLDSVIVSVNAYNSRFETYIQVHEHSEQIKKQQCKEEFMNVFTSRKEIGSVIKDEFEKIKDRELDRKDKKLSIINKIAYIVIFAAGIAVSQLGEAIITTLSNLSP